MKTKIKKFLGILMIFSFLVLTGQSCRKGGSLEAQKAFQSITLEYWTVFNSPSDYKQIIADYQALHPNIKINVQKLLYDEYEDKLINALAEDRGPDILSLHNTWLPAYRNKLVPLPDATTLAYQYAAGTIKKEVTTELRTARSLNEFDLRSQFVEQVYNDVFIPERVTVKGKEVDGENKIFALPVAFDTMVLYYNRDLLDNAGIAQPASDWVTFQNHITKLARFDSEGRILSAGAAMGTSNNVPRAVDILSILMMQGGAVMVNDGGSVAFDEIPAALSGIVRTSPGEDAVKFYTSFANPNQRAYTWNGSQPDGFESFLQGKVAYFFGYSYHKPQIEGLAPKLNFGVANLPQVEGNPIINYANYWVEAVSRKTDNLDAAWDFVQFMTSSTEAKKFVDETEKPTARRDLLEAQTQDPEMSIFASQVLNAKSWYNGNDAAAMESIMNNLIDGALAGASDVGDLVELAAQRVQQTMR